ncbi:hypothetical protein MPTK1_2g02210 [Marchantia polymorpha subsp. ruderalis]|nr:hypothetical protein MARPO_0130s0028 [Marchantia polymorpha]BBN00796.1 hypothetical protein Mp_2g02210 [Marchantia polymorpha subsp. ruderalis]|eukprot:PTQ30073.1 hypothetical protein MARPO_0130s0028 [Marchantia polymorpha]
MAARNLGVCVDHSPGSFYALNWTMENFAKDGDNVYIIVVNKKNALDETKLSLWGESGSPPIPFDEFKDPNVIKNYGVSPSTEINGIVSDSIKKKKVKVFMKVYFGDAREKITKALAEIPVHAAFMGSRGLSRLEKVLMGSVTNHVVNHAGCPVTVIKLPGESHH